MGMSVLGKETDKRRIRANFLLLLEVYFCVAVFLMMSNSGIDFLLEGM